MKEHIFSTYGSLLFLKSVCSKFLGLLFKGFFMKKVAQICQILTEKFQIIRFM